MGQLYVPINSQGEEITYRYGTVRVARACLRNRKNLLRIPNWVYNVPVMKRALPEKPLHWVGSAKDDLLEFPEEVVDDFGYALYLVQIGGKPPNAKPWKGEDSGVFEIIEDQRGDTYRAVYTVRFSEAVYVLHCFQKKSPSGIRTARADQNRIHDRLRAATEDYEVRYGRKKA